MLHMPARYIGLFIAIVGATMGIVCGDCLGTEDSSAPDPRTPPPASSPSSPDDSQTWNSMKLARIAASLGDERFQVRDAASRELSSAPLGILGPLVSEAAKSEDPEIRLRLQDAAKTIFMEKLLPQLEDWKKGRGFLGIAWSISDTPPGVLVSQILPGTSAEKAGLKPGDIIVQIDTQECAAGFSNEDAIKIWKAMAPGDPMKLKIRRDGADTDVNLMVGEIPKQYSRGEEDNEHSGEALWSRYLAGTLRIPDKILALTSPAAPNPSASASAGESRSPIATRKLQSWPQELEAKKQ